MVIFADGVEAVSHWVGSALYYWILTEKGKIIARTTVQHAT